MKPKTKLPPSQIGYSMTNGLFVVRRLRISKRAITCLVLPMPSLKSARQRAKWENLSEAERVDLVAAQLFHPLADYCRAKNPEAVRREQARAVLAVMEGRTL